MSCLSFQPALNREQISSFSTDFRINRNDLGDNASWLLIKVHSPERHSVGGLKHTCMHQWIENGSKLDIRDFIYVSIFEISLFSHHGSKSKDDVTGSPWRSPAALT